MTDKLSKYVAEINSWDKHCSKCGQELKKNFNFEEIGLLLVIVIIAIFSSGIHSKDNSQNNLNFVYHSHESTINDEKLHCEGE